MNTIDIMGNLVKDPVVRNTKTGKVVAAFSVATHRNYTTPQGEQKQLTDYINVVVWGDLAVSCGQRLQKGSYVFVQGRQSTRSYDDQNGQKRWVTEVIASVVALPLPSTQQKQQPQGNGYGNNNGGQWGSNRYGNQSQGGPNGGYGGQQYQGGNNPQGNNNGGTGHGNSPDWGQFGDAYQEPQAMKQGSVFGSDEDVPF